MEPIKGRAWIFPDDVNTDVIYPGRYMSITDAEETPKYLFETVYPDFRSKAKPGDIIVAGKYFGCGSSREQAATAIRYFGIACVVAYSFARIFYRNAINLGLPIAVVPGIREHVEITPISRIGLIDFYSTLVCVICGFSFELINLLYSREGAAKLRRIPSSNPVALR